MRIEKVQEGKSMTSQDFMNWMLVFPPNVYVEPKSSMAVFGDRASEEVIKVKWGEMEGALIKRD